MQIKLSRMAIFKTFEKNFFRNLFSYISRIKYTSHTNPIFSLSFNYDIKILFNIFVLISVFT